MKHITKLLAGALFFSTALISCSNNDELLPETTPDGIMPMRELKVTVAPVSRTTIEYENADVSHLVWSDGDEVAYITDYTGDKFHKAVISHNTFTAVIPEGATADNKLTIVYPAGDLEGKESYELALSPSNPSTINVDNSFDGTRLPMASVMNVPSSNSITANFEVMASVLRLNVLPGNHGSEKLTEVTLSANQALGGSYRKSYYGWFLDEGAKSVTMAIESADPTLSALSSNENYIYFVVPRTSYTGVNLTIKTDAGIYNFNDGKMDLSQEGKTLYRLDVTLGDPTPQPKPMFRKITSIDDITLGDASKYILVCEDKSVIYSEYTSTNYYEGVPVTIESDGIDPEDSKVTDLQFSIYKYTSSDRVGRYYLKCDKTIGRGQYIGMMPNFPGTPGKVYYDSSPDYNENSWDISFDSDGNIKLKGHPNTQDVAGDVFLGFYRPGNYFSTYGQDAAASQISQLQLYKLTE